MEVIVIFALGALFGSAASGDVSEPSLIPLDIGLATILGLSFARAMYLITRYIRNKGLLSSFFHWVYSNVHCQKVNPYPIYFFIPPFIAPVEVATWLQMNWLAVVPIVLGVATTFRPGSKLSRLYAKPKGN